MRSSSSSLWTGLIIISFVLYFSGPRMSMTLKCSFLIIAGKVEGPCVFIPQSCLTLYNTIDCSPPGSSVHGILQARILAWVAIPFSRGSSWPRGLNSGLQHCRWILYHLSYQGTYTMQSPLTPEVDFQEALGRGSQINSLEQQSLLLPWSSSRALLEGRMCASEFFLINKLPRYWCRL